MGKIMMNGIQYGVGGIEQAKDISYDNTESGATATDVQGALDELNAGLTDVLEWKTLTAAIGSNATRTIPVDASEIHEILVEGWYYGESETTIRTAYVFDGQAVIQNNWFLDIFVANTRLYCRIVINGTSLTVSGYTSSSTGNRIVLKYR